MTAYAIPMRTSSIDPRALAGMAAQGALEQEFDFAGDDVDLVDDALLNVAPHNRLERQLLLGDVVGLALVSGAALWSVMGAFG